MRMSEWSSDVCSSDVEACTHPALGKRQALSLKIDRAGRDRNPRAGSTRIAVCADDICGHGDPRQIISRRLCVGVSLGGLDGPPDAADYVELVRDADSRSEEHTSELQSLMRTS